MPKVNPQQAQVISRCQSSVVWFLRNFGKLKHPSAGILPFYPFSYQRTAIKSFREHRLTIFRKCRQCFRGDQMVWGPFGPRRIDSIKSGDPVYSYNTETGRLDIIEVQEVFDNGEREVCEIISKTGHSSVATLDHHYFTYTGQVRAAELTPNDRLLEVNDWPRIGIVANRSEAILLGYLIADGYYGYGNSKQGHFTNTCWRYLLEFQKHFYLLHGLRRPIKPHSRNKNSKITSYRVYSSHKTFWNWLEELGIAGQTKDTKRIPDRVFSWDNDSIALFLNRLFAADGWYSGGNCNEVGIGQESLVLLHQIKQLLSRFNIDSRVYYATESNMPKLRIYGGRNFQLFVENIGIFGKEPRQAITKGFFFNRKKGEVKKVISTGETTRVYDLKVPPYNNYIVDGAVVHNSGISKISGAFALWFAMFHAHKTILIVSRRNEDAMSFLRDHVVFLFEHLPQWMQDVWKPVKQNEHEIIFPNGSRIQSLTSHPDVLRSHASSLNIIDEAAFIQGMDVMWAGGWPTLQHGGNVIVISTCVAPDTLVNTENGLCEIKDLAPSEYDGFDDGYYHSNYDGPDIVGVDGPEPATKFYKRPVEKTKIVTTSCGYEFEASLFHKLPTVLSDGTIGNKYVHDLDIGDFLPVKAGQMVFGNDDRISFSRNNLHVDTITEDLAYLIGVVIAEGHVRRIDKYTANVTIACGDSSVLDKCESWGNLTWNRGRVGQDYVTTCYTPTFVVLLEELGVECTTAPFKTIPQRLLRCSEPVIRHFLRGLFDGDGSAHSRQGQVCYTSTSKKLIKQVRMLLFNYGIHTYLEVSPPGTTAFKRSNGETTIHDTKESYRLYISNNFTELFYDLIGFDLDRKQVLRENKTSVWSELMPPVVKILLKELKDTTDLSVAKMTELGLAPNVLFGSRSRITKNRLASFMSKISYEGNRAYDSLKKLLEYDWFNEIRGLEESENEVYDFTLPKTHTFIGDCTVHANTNGVGNWYWSTCTDAEAGVGGFHPVIINWWDMDWAIEYTDPLSRQQKRIAPRDGIRKSRTKDEINKFGPYWSPWLKEQYDALQEQGEGWKFEQEILANFIGSGNTVVDKNVIAHVQTTVKEPAQRVSGYQTYVHPVSGNIEEMSFDFDTPEEGLYIWERPIIAAPEKRRSGQVVEPGQPAHSYSMGVDIATGKGRDYSAIEVFDVDTMEQVAEFMARCLPRDFVKYIDRIGRWYNSAIAVVERNNGGDVLIDSLRYDYMYPRIWRKRDINDKPRGPKQSNTQRAMKVQPYGFSTSVASKPTLNKYLIDFIRDREDDGYRIYSKRLLKQIQTYVRKRDRIGRDTNKTEAEEGAGNFDDLVIATALAFVGVGEAFVADSANLMPFGGNADFKTQTGPIIYSNEQAVEMQRQMMETAGPALLAPMSLAPDELPEISAQRQLEAYTMQLGGIPIGEGKPLVTPPKWFYSRDK